MRGEFPWFLVAMAAVPVAYAIWAYIATVGRGWPRYYESLREKIEEEFRSTKRDFTSGKGAFDGSKAIVLLDWVTTAAKKHLIFYWPTPSLHRICRSEQGEYFLYMKQDGEPAYLNHLTAENARQALRRSPEAYRAEFGEGD